MPKTDIGVLTEQGFAVGHGLGYEKLSEADKAKIKDDRNDKDKKDRK